jgi:hypothetical protein
MGNGQMRHPLKVFRALDDDLRLIACELVNDHDIEEVLGRRYLRMLRDRT